MGTVTHFPLPASRVVTNCSGTGVSTGSDSSPASGTHVMFTSLHFAVVTSAPYDCGPKNTWHPSTLSMATVGTAPVHCTCTETQLTSSRRRSSSSFLTKRPLTRSLVSAKFLRTSRRRTRDRRDLTLVVVVLKLNYLGAVVGLGRRRPVLSYHSQLFGSTSRRGQRVVEIRPRVQYFAH